MIRGSKIVGANNCSIRGIGEKGILNGKIDRDRGGGAGNVNSIFHEDAGVGFKVPDYTVYVLHSQQGEAFRILDRGNNDFFTGEYDGDVTK